MLFLGFAGLFSTLVALLHLNTLVSIFSYAQLLYKFNFLNLTYLVLVDGISIYFISLTTLLFIVCVLVA